MEEEFVKLLLAIPGRTDMNELLSSRPFLNRLDPRYKEILNLFIEISNNESCNTESLSSFMNDEKKHMLSALIHQLIKITPEKILSFAEKKPSAFD